jgi:hypothetical protein
VDQVPGRELEHGKINTYVNHGCRCSDCRAAWASYMRSRRKTAHSKRHEHGTWNAYNNLGCRCEPCVAAAKIVRAEYKAYRAQQNGDSPPGASPRAVRTTA